MVFVKNLVNRIEKFIKAYRKEYGDCIKLTIKAEFSSGRIASFDVEDPDYFKIKEINQKSIKLFNDLINKINEE